MINIVKQSENLFIINDVKFNRVTNFFMPIQDLYCLFEDKNGGCLFGKINSYYPHGNSTYPLIQKYNFFAVSSTGNPAKIFNILFNQIIKVGGKEILEDMIFT